MGENTRNHYYNVDLNKPLSKRYSGLLLASGDNNGDVFHFAISKDGVNLVENDSVTFTAYFIRGDDITVTPEVVKENGVVHVTLDDTCYRREGRFVLAVKSTLSGNTTTIAIVDGYIRQTDSGNYIADEEQTITLDKIQGMANDMALFYEQAKDKMEELSGAIENLENALEEAETLPEKLPYIGDNGNWMQWDDDAGKFIDSGSPSRGIPGVNGTTPVKGKDYFDGEPGYTPQKNIDYFDGTSVTVSNVSESTADGGTNVVTFSDGKKLNVKNGSKGKDGVDGKTPVAGVDYFTEADKAELVEAVKSQIGEVDGDYAPAIHADQHSWNDTLTWDGDTTGRVSAHYATGVDYYLVSDKVPTVDDIANGYTVKAWDKIADKEHCFEGSFSRIEEWGCLCSDGGIYDYTMAIVPTDNYTIEMYDITFPKKGIYFLKYVSNFDGEDQIVTSLTIPGYAFDEGTDPITPEMISAAPHNHASESYEYGIGTDKKYGHLKVADLGDIFIPSDDWLMTLPPEMDEDDPQGSLKNYAFSAFMGYVTNNLFATWLTDVDNQLTMTDEIISALKKEVNNLKSEVEALKGGS